MKKKLKRFAGKTDFLPFLISLLIIRLNFDLGPSITSALIVVELLTVMIAFIVTFEDFLNLGNKELIVIIPVSICIGLFLSSLIQGFQVYESFSTVVITVIEGMVFTISTIIVLTGITELTK